MLKQGKLLMGLEDKILSCKTAAVELGLSASQVRRLCASGRIKAIKNSHDWIIPVTALNTYIRMRNKQKENME
jgi:hypothetical protein